MEDQLVSYKTAVLAKEKGFHSTPGRCYYGEEGQLHWMQIHCVTWHQLNKNYKNYEGFLAPTQSLLGRWLREKHNCYVEIRWHSPLDGSAVTSDNIRFVFEINYYGKDFNIPYTDSDDLLEFDFMTYEEALEEGLYQGLLLIK